MNPQLQQFLLKVLLPAILKYFEEHPEVLSRLVDALLKQIMDAFEKAVKE